MNTLQHTALPAVSSYRMCSIGTITAGYCLKTCGTLVGCGICQSDRLNKKISCALRSRSADISTATAHTRELNSSSDWTRRILSTTVGSVENPYFHDSTYVSWLFVCFKRWFIHSIYILVSLCCKYIRPRRSHVITGWLSYKLNGKKINFVCVARSNQKHLAFYTD